jgi:hypothetical protein
MSLPEEPPARAPRAVAYARANQGVDRYRRRSPRRRADGQRSSGRPARRSLNHTRFWFFTAVLVVALALAAAMLGAVSAGPAPVARRPDPPAAGPEPPEGPAPLTAAPAPSGRTGNGAGAAGRPEPGSAAEDGPATPPGAQALPGPSAGAGERSGRTAGGGRAHNAAPTGPQAGGRGTTAPEEGEDGVVYRNCGQARRAGAAPLHRGEPGYSAELDRDGDGVACAK